jgi:hypothetical protein
LALIVHFLGISLFYINSELPILGGEIYKTILKKNILKQILRGVGASKIKQKHKQLVTWGVHT